jgi:AcrR family transcriptional regulator
LEKAIEVFGEQGMENYSLKDVSLRAQVTPATIYYYFGNKQELIEQTVIRHVLPPLKSFWDTMEEVEDPVEMVRALQEKILEATLRYSWFAPLWSREFGSQGNPLRTILRKHLDIDPIGKFCRKIRKGQEKGLINPGIIPEMLYVSIFGSVFIPVLAIPVWGSFFNVNVTIDALKKHIVSTALFGTLCPGVSPHLKDNQEPHGIKTPDE